MNNPLSATDPTGYTSAGSNDSNNCDAGGSTSCNGTLDSEAMTGTRIKGVDTGATCSGHCSSFVLGALTGALKKAQDTLAAHGESLVMATDKNGNFAFASLDQSGAKLGQGTNNTTVSDASKGAGTGIAETQKSGGNAINAAAAAAVGPVPTLVNPSTGTSQLQPVNLDGLSEFMQHGEAYLDARTYEKVKNSEAGVYAEFGIRLQFTNAFRTPADTEALRDLGDHPSLVSAHMCGCAIDINWGALPRSAQPGVVGIFRANGLEWGGKFHDQPIDERHHFYDVETLRTAPIKELIHDAQTRYEELTGGGQ